MRFHQVHGCNITLSKDNTVATRCQSFANALVFSERPLEPDEVFVFEISDQQDRWAGNLRCGITYHNPEHITVPQYLLPDFMKLGKSFVFAIKPCAEDPFSDKKQDYIETIEKCPDIKFCDHIDKSLFTKTCAKLDIHPCEVGSRIGIFLSPHRELYFIINGIQYGPCTKSIPDHLGVYATADLYGNTKQIKIINYHVPRLKTLCKHIIRKSSRPEEIKKLSIPRMLKMDLLLGFEKTFCVGGLDEDYSFQVNTCDTKF